MRTNLLRSTWFRVSEITNCRSSFDLIDDDLQIFLAVADTLLAVLAAAEMHREKFDALNNTIIGLCFKSC